MAAVNRVKRMTANEFLTILFAGVSILIVQFLFGCASPVGTAAAASALPALSSIFGGGGTHITVNIASRSTTCTCSPCPK